jgi:hypothetical protein
MTIDNSYFSLAQIDTYVAKNVISRHKSPRGPFRGRTIGDDHLRRKPDGHLWTKPGEKCPEGSTPLMAIYGRSNGLGYREYIHPSITVAVPRLPDSNPSKSIQSLPISPSSVHCTLPPAQSRLSSMTSVPTYRPPAVSLLQ